MGRGRRGMFSKRRDDDDVRDCKIGPNIPAYHHPEMSFCSRICAEMFMPPFGLHEADGKVVDVVGTFSPDPLLWTGIYKALVFIMAALVIVDGILEYDPFYFYFAYISNLALILTMLYFCCALINTIRQPIINTTRHVSFLIKLTWLLFVVAMPAEIFATILFWALEYKGPSDLTYLNIMLHGVFMLLLLVDGLWINKLPIRLSQQWYFFGFIALYFIWTWLHAYLEIGDPQSEDDDVVFAAMQWNDDPYKTLIIGGVCLLVVAPAIFNLIWLLSLYSCPCSCSGSSRRYLDLGEARHSLIASKV